jgi:hypothetical protein
MIEGYSLQIGFTFKSEPQRYFLFFRPKDLIVDDDFRVIVHLKNTGKEFPGGSISIRNEFDEKPLLITKKEYKGFDIPRIPPNTEIEVPAPFPMKSPHVGTNYLSILMHSSDNKKITCFPLNGGGDIDLKEHRFPFHVSSKETIYQYYGVWFAIALSLVAIGLSVTNAIIALLQYLNH